MAEEEGALTNFNEVANNEPPSITIIATLRSVLLKLDRIAGVSGQVKGSLWVLRRFVGAVKMAVECADFVIDIEGEPVTAVGRPNPAMQVTSRARDHRRGAGRNPAPFLTSGFRR